MWEKIEGILLKVFIALLIAIFGGGVLTIIILMMLNVIKYFYMELRG